MLTLNLVLITKLKDIFMYSLKQHNTQFINFLTFFHFKTGAKAQMKVNMPFFPPVEPHMPDLMLSESMGTIDLIFRMIMPNALSHFFLEI